MIGVLMVRPSVLLVVARAAKIAQIFSMLGLMFAAAPAAAAGTDSLVCAIGDRTLQMELVGSTSFSGDTRVSVQTGHLVLNPGPFANEPAAVPIMQSNLILQWVIDRTLRFVIHVETGNYGETVLLTMMATRTKHSATYHGGYVLKRMGPRGTRSVSGQIRGCTIS
jgi:hypothetical protein